MAAQTQSAIASMPITPGISGAFQMTSQVAVAEWSAGDRQRWVQVTDEVKPKPKPKPVEPPKPAEPAVTVQLGDDKTSNLRVLLTSHGAAVQEVILNQFEAATSLGLPASPPRTLHLV